MKKFLFAGALAAVLLATALTGIEAQEPRENIDPNRHPNLAAAQQLSREAFNRITAAQQANEYDLGGHAGRAKELLREANEEMKRAALFINRH